MNFKDYKTDVYRIIGAAMKVHSSLGWGLLEPLYNEAMSMELSERGINNEPEKKLQYYYKGQLMKKFYQMDIVVGDIIVELKSTNKLIANHRLQLFNYLRLTKKPIGLLINFGQKSLQGERYGYSKDTNECVLLDKNMEPVYEMSLPEDEDSVEEL